MPNTLDVHADQRRLRFFDNLRVQEIGPGDSILQETDWESVSGERENEISFRFPGESRTSLAVRYSFNSRNQLTLQVIEQPGVPQASDTWTLPGSIAIAGVEDVSYLLIDEEGRASGRKITIYARLDFPEGYRRLRVRLPDASEAFITGSNKHRSLSAGEYLSGGDLARDLLEFQANTRNTIQGLDEDTPADIKFYGRWDMRESSLVFVTRYDNSAGGEPVAYLALGGEIRGTNFGLVIEEGGKAAFQINGRYEWNRGKLAWDLKVGYSRSSGIEASLGADAEVVGKKGKLTIKGAATLKKGAQTAKLTFDLSVAYEARDRRLAFRMTGAEGSYEIQFSGDFRLRNGNVKFEITFADKDGAPTVRGVVEFGLYTKNAELRLSLEAVLGRNGLALKLNLEFRFYWGPSGPVAEVP